MLEVHRPINLFSDKNCSLFFICGVIQPDVFCAADDSIEANVFISLMSMRTGKIYEMVRYFNSHDNFKLYLFRQFQEIVLYCLREIVALENRLTGLHLSISIGMTRALSSRCFLRNLFVIAVSVVDLSY